MAWMTDNLVGNTSLSNVEADISKIFIVRDPEYAVIEVVTADSETGDLYLYDSSDGQNWTQVATVAVNAASRTVWRVSSVVLRDQCKVTMKLDSGTGTVVACYVTRDV